MFKIEWVNHASYIFDDGEIRLITDPWVEGSVFNESWSLLAKTKFQYEDYKNITHIWFSHEHPDHFFPPNLKKIPEEYRKNITVLFQKTDDKKVVNFCKYLGFKDVVETSEEFYKISNQTSIYIKAFSPYDSDSWHLLKYKEFKLLNVNDCVLGSRKSIEEIKEITGEVDYLFTQFSYANWVGNPDDESGRKNHAREKLNRIKNQIEIFNPKFVVPFASFVYFSKRDNAFMNTTINKIGDVKKFLESFSVKPIIFYPGDLYSGEEWNRNEENIKKYNLDLENGLKSIDSNNFPVSSIEDIKRAFEKGPFYNFNLNGLFARAFTRIQGTPFCNIYLNDIEKVVHIDIENKKISEVKTDSFDINMCSQNLKYLLSFEWGPGTILIAGTFFTKHKRGLKFINYMSEISHCVGQNKRFSTGFVISRIMNLIYGKLQKIKDKIIK